MIPLGEKSKREKMILEAKINREHMKMGLEEGRKDEEHDFSIREKEMKLKEQEIKLQKAQQELEAKYQEMMLKRADLEFKSEIEKTKLQMEMQKQKAEIHMDLADRQMQSQREDDAHNVKMSHENNKNQLDLHKRSSDAHMNQQLKYHSAKAKAAADPEAPHDVPELDLRDIPKPQAFKPSVPDAFKADTSAYEKGTKSVMGKVKMPNMAMPKPSQGYHHGGYAEEKALGGMGARMAQHPPAPQGYWFGIDDVPDPRKQQGAQIQQRLDSQGNPIKGNYVLADTSKPPTPSPSTATLANAMGPQQRWELEQKRKAQRGYAHGGQIPHPMTGKTPTNPEAGPSDTVPAMLTPGEAVIPREAAQNPKNKPIIDKLINEGRHVQKYGRGTMNVPGYSLGQHNVPGYFEGSTGVEGQPSGVADTDVYWTNQGEATITAQNEEEKKRRMQQQVAPVQNEDGSSQAMGVPPVQATPENTTVEFESKKVEPPAVGKGGATAPEAESAPPDLTPHAEAAEAAVAKSGAKDELGIAGSISGAIKSLGDTMGFSPEELKRVAVMAAGSRLLGYPMNRAIGHAFKTVGHQAEKRRDLEQQDKKLIAAEQRQDKRLEAQDKREDKKIAAAEARTDARITAQNLRDDKRFAAQLKLDEQKAQEQFARDEFKAKQQYERDVRLANSKYDRDLLLEKFKEGRESRLQDRQGRNQMGNAAQEDYLKQHPGDFQGAYLVRHHAMSGADMTKGVSLPSGNTFIPGQGVKAEAIGKWADSHAGSLENISKRYTVGSGHDAKPALDLTGAQASSQMAREMVALGVDLKDPTEAIAARTIADNAMRRAAEDAASGRVKSVKDVSPYLRAEMLVSTTGLNSNDPLLTLSKGKAMPVESVSSLSRVVQDTARKQLGADAKAPDVNDFGNQVMTELRKKWQNNKELRDKWENSSTDTGFARFARSEFEQLGKK